MNGNGNKPDVTGENKPVGKKKKLSAARSEAIRWDPDAVFRENPYYTRIAFRFRICKYLTAALALIFTVLMLTVYGDDITSENFRYFLKDLDITGLTAGEFSHIIHSGGTGARFAVYRGELAVVNPGNTLLYRSGGALSFSSKNIFYSPRLISSDKYMLVYDYGDTTCSYSLYNSFAELKKGRLDKPITGAALSDSGSYLLITRDSTYKGVLYWYDSDFEPVAEIKKDKYMITAALSDDGKKLVLASCYDSGGDIMTELVTVAEGSDAAGASYTASGVMPMKTGIMKGGNIVLLCTDRVMFFDPALKLLSTVIFDYTATFSADVGKELFLTAAGNSLVGNEKTITVYSPDGQVKAAIGCSGELIAMRSCGGLVYAVTENSVIRFDPETGKTAEVQIEPNAIDIIFTSTGKPIVCYAGSAAPVSFDSAPQESATADTDK